MVYKPLAVRVALIAGFRRALPVFRYMIVVAVAVVMWESPQGFPRGVGRVESRLYGFPCFPYPGISMACFESTSVPACLTAQTLPPNEAARVSLRGSIARREKRLIPLALLSHKITFRVFPAKNACQAPKPPNSFKQNNIDVAY